MDSFDVGVRGSGVVAQCLALSLARQGLRVALAASGDQRADDVRAYALNAASVELLRSLKVWDALPSGARTAVHDMHVEGDRAGAVLEFSAWQQAIGELAWIVDAAALERELAAAVRFAPHVTVSTPTATDREPRASLVAYCEGRASASRDALGIGFERHDYGQTAIAARLVSDRPHRNVARQWFRSPDVLALLPFDAPQPGGSFALVWSLPTDRAAELLAADEASFEDALNVAVGHDLDHVTGRLKLASKRAAWPLMRAEATRWSGPGWVLLGDSAHVVHPLAGQGLNLGLADIVALCRVIAEREPWRPLGDEKLLRRYVRERIGPTRAMGRLTEGLLMLFAHDGDHLRELRNRGLTLVNHLGPMKRWLAARALDA